MCDGNLAMQNEYEHGTLREPAENDKCPECGNKNTVASLDNELGEGFRVCTKCGQEWWLDVEYSTNAK